mmetsp:Transcript_59087/g.129433  ORF Transcript_59087/g.129433 Transcript_59087/m.129433 type:complete len:142 (-) Transcript_59087:9-434(-)
MEVQGQLMQPQVVQGQLIQGQMVQGQVMGAYPAGMAPAMAAPQFPYHGDWEACNHSPDAGRGCDPDATGDEKKLEIKDSGKVKFKHGNKFEPRGHVHDGMPQYTAYNKDGEGLEVEKLPNGNLRMTFCYEGKRPWIEYRRD